MRFRKPKEKTLLVGHGIGSVRFRYLDKSSWFKHEIKPLSLDILTKDGWVPVSHKVPEPSNPKHGQTWTTDGKTYVWIAGSENKWIHLINPEDMK